MFVLRVGKGSQGRSIEERRAVDRTDRETKNTAFATQQDHLNLALWSIELLFALPRPSNRPIAKLGSVKACMVFQLASTAKVQILCLVISVRCARLKKLGRRAFLFFYTLVIGVSRRILPTRPLRLYKFAPPVCSLRSAQR